jgi:hypothetical protein
MTVSLDLATVKAHLNVTDSTDDGMIQTCLDRALAYTKGFCVSDSQPWPNPVPDDLAGAILTLASTYYGQREATIAGFEASEAPFGFWDAIARYRVWAF